MNNTESKEPLYRQLNKERTKGDWNIIGDDKTILSVPDGKMTICAMNHTHPVKEWNRGVKAAQANAKYVSLAVNNLSSLAEALEIAIKMFWSNERTYNRQGLKEKYPEHYIWELEQALNKIS